MPDLTNIKLKGTKKQIIVSWNLSCQDLREHSTCTPHVSNSANKAANANEAANTNEAFFTSHFYAFSWEDFSFLMLFSPRLQHSPLSADKIESNNLTQ
jgi:hypothetical protein